MSGSTDQKSKRNLCAWIFYVSYPIDVLAKENNLTINSKIS